MTAPAKPAAQLAPCPFCGGDAGAMMKANKEWRVWCLRPEAVCGMIGPSKPSEGEAIAAWNRRAKPAASEWQPIEEWKPEASAHWPYLSALVAVDGVVMEADWKPGESPPKTGEWWPANTDSEYGDRIYPTHWMPLPDPPLAEPHLEATP